MTHPGKALALAAVAVVVVTCLTWGPTIRRTIRRHCRVSIPVRFILPALVTGGALYLASKDSWGVLVSVLILAGMLAWAAYMSALDRAHHRNTPPAHHPVHGAQQRLRYGTVPGCTQCMEADPPPCDEHGARELAGIPPYYPERVIMRAGWPPELADIEKRLSDEDSLAAGDAAEQAARSTADPSTEGTHQ